MTKKKMYCFILIALFAIIFYLAILFYGRHHISSDRYFSPLLVIYPLLSPVAVFFILKKIIVFKRTKALFGLLVFCFVLFQIIISFDGFRDIYISLANDALVYFSREASVVFLPQKDSLRFSDKAFLYKEIIPETDADIEIKRLFRNYKYWEHAIILIQKNKKEKVSFPFVPSGRKLRIISKLFTNKKKHSYVFFQSSPSTFFKEKNGQDFTISEKNVFKNSNLENQRKESDVARYFQKWADDGAFFYMYKKYKRNLLPLYVDLPAQYHITTIPYYPIAYSEIKSPIEGKYSLHVVFNYPRYSTYNYYVSLLHSIDNEPGTLSFYAKAVKPNSHLVVTKIENDDFGRWVRTQPEYHILLNNKDPNLFSFDFEQSDFISKRSLFLLHGTHADIILDLIQYIPFTSP